IASFNRPLKKIHDDIQRWIADRFDRLEAGSDGTGLIDLSAILRMGEYALVSNADALNIYLAGIDIITVDVSESRLNSDTILWL
ncbi:hypothetical protein COCVIDRAFT_111935, partial [Bipolaris victoriae FI3]